ncbi:MAG: hypothetical protein CMJ83_03655, partial [Planctomycetes bacterium]|nr:hypothetical protein [Planctomycetota bacterium]
PKLAWPDGHTPRFDARGVLGPGHHTVTSRPIHTRLERGTLHHPGDGTVSIRLTGKLTGGPLEVLVGSGRDRTTAIWPPNTPEITVPLLHLGPNGPIRIAVRAPTGPALVDLATLDVVTDLDLAESVAASVTPPTAAANGWECTATLDDAPLVTPGAALVLRIQAAASALQVHLTTTDTKRPPLVATIGALSGGGTAVINLHAIEGATLSRIVVRGAGTASETGVSELRIARAKWPRER